MIGLLVGVRIFVRFTQVHWAIIGFLLTATMWHYLLWLGILLSLLPLIYFIFSNIQFWKKRGEFETIKRNRAWAYFVGISLGFYLKDIIISFLIPYLPS